MERLKTLIAVAVLATVTLGGASCSDDDYDYDKNLRVDSGELVFAANDPYEQTVSVVTDADNWTAFASEEWVDVVLDGDNARIKVKENAAGGERHTLLTFRAKGAEDRSIIVRQTASDIDYLIMNITEAGFTKEGGERLIAVTTTYEEWGVGVENTPAWITAAKVDPNTILLSVARNNVDVERSAIVLVTATGMTGNVTLNVTQAVDDTPAVSDRNYDIALLGYETGDDLNYFELALQDSSDPIGGDLQLIIIGYCESGETGSFVLQEGVYTIGDDAAAGTILRGGENTLFYTYGSMEQFYYYLPGAEFPVGGRMLFFTDGQMEVSYDAADEEYTITAVFDGQILDPEDSSSYSVYNQRYSFTGWIQMWELED